jgi:hypothetical protein
MQKTNNLKMSLQTILTNLKTKYIITNETDLLTLFLKMVVLILLLFMDETTVLLIIVPILTIPGLLINKLILNKYYWVLLALATSIPYLLLDLVGYVPNHKHIFAYLTIAICLTLFISNTSSGIKNLSLQAKYIIGLCFLFAVIGKFLAPEFLNGSFFEFTNTADPRFFGFTSFVGDVDMQSLLSNEANIIKLTSENNPNYIFQLNGVENLKTIGMLISYWTIFIEGMIAISFCLPNRFLVSKYRNVFLIAFIITTYPIATVAGFAIVLTTMGFIQSIKDNKLTNYSLFYLLVFIILPLIKIPFLRVLNMIF